MPVVPRQLLSEISQAIQSRISTASTAVLGPTATPVQPIITTTTSTRGPLLPSIPVVPNLTSVQVTSTPVTSISVLVSTTSVAPLTTTSAIPTTTSVAPVPTQTVTSTIQIVSTSTSSTSALLSLTTPAVSETPEVIASTSAVVVSASASASPTATGIPSNAGSSTQADGNMSGGIIGKYYVIIKLPNLTLLSALIVVGALLAALLGGAFAFRRIQVYRRAKRRENKFGLAVGEGAPLPFTNVSETDLKGAQPIRDPVVNYNEKPLPSIIPDLYPAPPNPTYNQYGQYGDNGTSGPYPGIGTAAMGYGYGQPGRASPAPSQIQAPRMTSPSPPPVAYAPGPSAYPNPYPKAPTSVPAPAAPRLAAPRVNAKKRVIQTFQPTLPDELDIQEGDWVTVLHAYDDGWGLCECNGRRGVVPLECLDPGKPDFRASRRFSSLSAIRQ